MSLVVNSILSLAPFMKERKEERKTERKSKKGRRERERERERLVSGSVLALVGAPAPFPAF
jgi:hypothetical protein